MTFDTQDFLKTLGKSQKNLKDYTLECAVNGCSKKSINSHLVQCHPFIESISENGHVMQFCDNDIHPMSGDFDVVKLNRLGINKALSMPLFCIEHDNNLFKDIEKGCLDIFDKKNQMLYSYRALCAIRYQEQKRLAFYKENRINNNIFKENIFEEQINVSKILISRMNSTITRFWDKLNRNEFNDYEFRVVKLPKQLFCISDCIIDNKELEEHIEDDNYNKPLYPLFIHYLPFEDNSCLILGIDNQYTNDDIKNYFYSWEDEYKKNEISKIKNLLLKVNNWCFSPKLSDSFIDYPSEKIDYIFDKLQK